MLLSKFLSTYKTGLSYGYNGYVGECVSLVKLYIKNVLGVTPQSIGNAKEYWNKRNSSTYLKQNFTFDADTPEIGDVFCRTSGTYGHVGIVYDVNYRNGTYKTIEQNHNNSRTVGRFTYNIGNGFHFLTPKNQSNIDMGDDESTDESGDSEDNPEYDDDGKINDEFNFYIYKYFLNIL